jgi:hypothetical protein
LEPMRALRAFASACETRSRTGAASLEGSFARGFDRGTATMEPASEDRELSWNVVGFMFQRDIRCCSDDLAALSASSNQDLDQSIPHAKEMKRLPLTPAPNASGAEKTGNPVCQTFDLIGFRVPPEPSNFFWKPHRNTRVNARITYTVGKSPAAPTPPRGLLSKSLRAKLQTGLSRCI